MHVFQIRGFSSILVLLLAVLALVALLVALPAGFLMVLWNALVYEGLKGPEINFYQGALLWGAFAALIKLVFKPEIKFQIMSANGAKKGGKPEATAMKSNRDATTDTEEESTVPDSAKLDNQN